MAELIVGKTANQVWRNASKLVIKNGILTKGRNGDTKELLHTFITIEDPRQKWVYDRLPPISIGYALAELVWIMNGEDRSDVINVWNPNLKKFAGHGEYYYGAYGKRIRSHFRFDQLEQAYYALQANPDSRQVVIQIYDTVTDFPINDGVPRSEDIPCNICSIIKVRSGTLEWTQIMRSNDILLGMPYNFVQFTSLQEILAGWLGINVGTYNHYSDSLHLYNCDCGKIGIDDTSEIINNDTLACPKKECDLIFREMYERMKILALDQVSEGKMYSLSQFASGYVAYDNMMLIITSYTAHKSNNNDLAHELVNRCTNEMFRLLWKKWLSNRTK